MLSDLLFIILGIGFLYYGAEWLVSGSCRLALRFGLAPLVIGLTIVAFGTSAPELVVCLRLNGTGSPNAAVGNVIGSNICNILLILGVSALIRPLSIKGQVLKREMPILILASLVLWVMLKDGQLGTMEAGGLTAGIIVYVWTSIKRSPSEESVQGLPSESGSGEDNEVPVSATRISALIIGGMCALVGGAELFQRGGVGLAEELGVSKAIIGLSVLAFGTSLPELATSVVACLKKQGDIIAGNAVGSSIFNILAILGITALVMPMKVPQISTMDLSVMLGSALLGVVLMAAGRRLTRVEGVFMLLGYIAYILLIAWRGGAV